MLLNEKTKRILNVLTVERKDILYKSAAIRKRIESLYLKALNKPT
jgi:hypothetical protein